MVLEPVSLVLGVGRHLPLFAYDKFLDSMVFSIEGNDDGSN